MKVNNIDNNEYFKNMILVATINIIVDSVNKDMVKMISCDLYFFLNKG